MQQIHAIESEISPNLSPKNITVREIKGLSIEEKFSLYAYDSVPSHCINYSKLNEQFQTTLCLHKTYAKAH